jgi:hypothetical protein
MLAFAQSKTARASEVLLLPGMFKGLFCLLAIGGGALIFTGHRIPLMGTDFSRLPGGPTVSGALLVLLGLWLAVNAD